MTNSTPVAVGDEICGYQLIRSIGRGGFGEVFEARKRGEARSVALKIMARAEADFQRRFHDEARLLARIDSPHVVRIYEVGALETGEPFIVMEYIGDGALTAWSRKGPMPPDHAVKIVGDLLVALDAAHRQGVIHRDVKESNVLIDLIGDRAALCDFGIARSVEPMPGEAPATGRRLLGTPHYTAPERLLRARDGGVSREDPRSDLYSVGVIFYRLLSGRRPFESHHGDTIALARAVLTGDVPPLPDHVHPILVEVCMRLLARDPEARYPTARAALRSLASRWAQVGRTRALPAVTTAARTTLSPGLPAAWLYAQGGAATVRTPPPPELLHPSLSVPIDELPEPAEVSELFPEIRPSASLSVRSPGWDRTWVVVALLTGLLLGVALSL